MVDELEEQRGEKVSTSNTIWVWRAVATSTS